MDGKTKNTLLIVDDESSNLKVLTNILMSEYTIYTATNGTSALEKARENRPDLILLDIIMPGMDGYQTLSEIKKCRELKNTPVIFITGLKSDEDEEKGLALEAADYIVKPFSAAIVKLRVRNQIQLKSAVIEAEAASQSKSAFLVQVSQEIRAPLNTILGISAIQLQNENYPNEIKEAFTRIFNSGDLLLGMVNDILDMSRIEAGKLDVIRIKYDIASMINDMVFLNLIKYQNKPVEFILNVDENVSSSFVGDEIRIKQILNNLLSNAFKYTSSGEVEMSVSVEKWPKPSANSTTVVFRVRDTGRGMTEEQARRLFDEQFRFNRETGGMIGGTGMGMSIVKNLTHMMGGEIFAESKPGEGSLFTVRLPQGDTGDPVLGKEITEKLRNFRLSYEEKAKKAYIENRQILKGRVLIVDDADINPYIVGEMLVPYGLETDVASSGTEAIGKVKKNKYDLIFMDYIMPVMNGIETAKNIKSLGQEYEKIPIIALTAHAVPGAREMFMKEGFNGFISKPVGLHELDDVLREWMQQGSAAKT